MPHEFRRDDGMVLSDDPAWLDLDRAWRWISQESYWAEGIPKATFDRAAANSLCVGVYDADGAMIGFARAVTDHATFAWICDVWIDASARGHGLGKALISYLMGHPELAGLRRWALATRDAHGLYAQSGFNPADAERGMERLDREIYRRNAGRLDVRD